MISHYTVMCSILQVAGGWHANEDYAPPSEQRLKAGDVISGGEHFLCMSFELFFANDNFSFAVLS